ncbi:MAG: TatD family hydrolase [Deltaproteobacteria bacterium]|nr:TatD family hydrolase [Deltaproteobacteria bacterium]
MIDTHVHLDAAAFDGDRAEVMARARAAGVDEFIVPGVRASSWARLRELSRQHGWRFAVGTHPHALVHGREVPEDIDGACAVGECGLDGGVPVDMDEQARVLEAHLGRARDARLPVILHCWRAHDRLPALLRRHGRVRGVLHSYSGGPDLVDVYVRLGLHLSFAGAVTRPGARKPVEALRRVPAERILVETDAPDQGPGPGRNEPRFLVDVATAVSRVRPDADLDANARALFG